MRRRNMAPMNPFNPPLAQGIRRFGFRKWYERELLSGHAHMALAVLAVIGLLASFEAFHLGGMVGRLLNTALVVVCGAVALWALRRYLFRLMHAEELANQANCPQCQSYGLLAVAETQDARPALRVRCKRCGAEWPIGP